MSALSKPQWRARIVAARRARDDEERRGEDAALAAAARSLAPARATVCAYVPVGSEPGALSLLDALCEAGNRVLLPLTRADSTLDWAQYTGAGALAPAGYGLLEPTGPALGPEEVRRAHTVLVPALAVDERGVRLGRGAGFYDRTLHLAAGDAVLVAVVRDEELVPELPEDPHDIRMGWALTPGRGLVPLNGSTGSGNREPR
ncbi:5-formyltetrahydrofolate cyclo-ligase [Rhodococcus sp. GXMU-t2271]|uniref:5-formyltetrahydrofolate cyclo-ligase n=1 Tax=Rhodococcus indonesiensis TaxID=3055869 RepID=A0ABT7RH21_9NOCA|nr:5-formyltetrahydrofolate cyclo-ligase [Rhodococcus indonesiensis]MDM7486937.1 5-formyltetrahydrofolate cyclo-ligase [Rhodococcus indonesiensis]